MNETTGPRQELAAQIVDAVILVINPRLEIPISPRDREMMITALVAGNPYGFPVAGRAINEVLVMTTPKGPAVLIYQLRGGYNADVTQECWRIIDLFAERWATLFTAPQVAPES